MSDAIEGRKFDLDKDRWDLVPWEVFTYVVKVLTYGARKYAAWSWLHVPNAIERYRAAALRHIMADISGELLDQETQLPHLAHAICCILFIMGVRRHEALVKTEPPIACEVRDVTTADQANEIVGELTKVVNTQSKDLREYLLTLGVKDFAEAMEEIRRLRAMCVPSLDEA